MKVALISFTTNPDLQAYLHNATANLSNSYCKCIGIGSADLKISDEVISPEVKLLNTPEKPGVSLGSLYMYIKNIRLITNILKINNINIVHFISKHSWNYLLIKLIRILFPGVIIIHTIHDPIGHIGEKKQKSVKFYYKTILKNIDVAIVHSCNSLKVCQENFHFKIPIYNVPLGEFHWKPYRDPIYSKKVLMFGRINAYKGCEYIPKIADELLLLNKDIELIVAGKPSEDISKDLIRELERKDNISFYPMYIPDDELESMIQEADIIILTYTSITQSGVIVQSYRHSKPIIAFNIEGMDEFIKSAETGYLIESFNIHQYASSVAGLIGDQQKLQELSKGAWKFGLANYNIEQMCKQFLNIYESSIKK